MGDAIDALGPAQPRRFCMRVLRIGIDGGCWLNRRGYGRYTRSLLSALARRGIIDPFGLAPERVRTILEAPDPIFRRVEAPREPSDLLPTCPLPRDGGRYLLYVGGLSPHKNLHLLLEAFRRLLAQGGFP